MFSKLLSIFKSPTMETRRVDSSIPPPLFAPMPQNVIFLSKNTVILSLGIGWMLKINRNMAKGFFHQGIGKIVKSQNNDAGLS